GGTTEIAVFSLGEVVSGASLRIGGDDMDVAIAEHLRRSYALKIGPQTAERLKIELGSASPLEVELAEEVGGIDSISNVPREAVREALRAPLDKIAEKLREVLERCPPELIADLADQGVVLTGGGSQLRLIDRFLAEKLGVPVRVASDPLRAVAEGATVCIENF